MVNIKKTSGAKHKTLEEHESFIVIIKTVG